MRAAYVEKTGPADTILVGELPRPTEGAGGVLVRVKAVSVNPINLYIRSGSVAMPLAFPYVLESDFAGVVESVGSEVKGLKPGDRVWGSNQGLLGRQGVASEYAAVDADWVYPTSDGVSDVDAAALALVGITAHHGLFGRAALEEGETVYVPGGSGGVGSAVVQMAKAAGARVATSAGSPEKVALCRDLGADAAWNYKSDDLAAGLRAFAPDGIDVWYETQREPDLETALGLMARWGRMVMIAGRAARPVLPLGAFYPKGCSLLGFAMFNLTPAEQRASAAAINALAASGALRAVVARTFPLNEAPAAEAFLEQTTAGGSKLPPGKVVITLD